jgi:hypothetical protein
MVEDYNIKVRAVLTHQLGSGLVVVRLQWT